MATILVNGCFDILHEGHRLFLKCAKRLGCGIRGNWTDFTLLNGDKLNRLVVAVNSDESARALKGSKWGEKYPIDNLIERCKKLTDYADEVVSFTTEEELRGLIEWVSPCIIVKGPDYAGKAVTGDDLAPVLILDTPEPDSVKKLKIELYGQVPADCDSSGKPSD